MGITKPGIRPATRVKDRIHFKLEGRDNPVRFLSDLGEATAKHCVVTTDELLDGCAAFEEAVACFEAGFNAGWELFCESASLAWNEKTFFYAAVDFEDEDTGTSIWARFWFIAESEDHILKLLEAYLSSPVMTQNTENTDDPESSDPLDTESPREV